MIASTENTNAAEPEFSARIDRSVVNVKGGSVRHLVLSVKAPAVPRGDGPRQPLNLGLVIDASGSMEGKPLEAAKQATLSLLDKLAARDHLSLVSFADDVICHAEAVRLDPPGRHVVAAAIRPLVTRGSTNLFEGWIGGCEAVAKRQAGADEPERNRVIVLSDGHANAGEVNPVRLAHHAGELRKRGVVTSTVGIGTEYSPVQLQAIAEAGGGRMHDAELPEEIAEIMFAELNDSLATTVENLEFRLQLPAGMTAEVYGTAPLNRDAEGCEILAGSLVGDSSRRVVVKLMFPAGGQDDTLSIDVSARWTTPGGENARTAHVGTPAVRFDRSKACLEQPRCEELARIVAEQWLAHVFQRGMMLNELGQFEAAREFAERQSRYFAAYCEGLPELQAAVAELREFRPVVSRRMDRMAAKEMFLHSYKTGRGEIDHRSRRRKSSREILADEAARQREEP
jgi:Ca-activated chloride channel family protein